MKLIKKFRSWLAKIFSKTEVLVDSYLPIAVNVVQAVKKVIANGSVDMIADIAKKLIPGTTDDAILDGVIAFAKKHIPVLCLQLEILEAANVSGGDAEVLKLALDKLKGTYGDKWDEFMSGLAGELVVYLADGKISAAEAIALAKKYYDTNFK